MVVQKITAIMAFVVIVLVVLGMTISSTVLALLASAQTVPSSGTINPKGASGQPSWQ